MAESSLVLLTFFLGAVPFGVIVGLMGGGVDLRQVGSGNIGATNVTRALGRKAGVETLLFDAAKGFVPVLLARSMEFSPMAADLVAAAAILGHCYSPYLGFRGGKGVAVGLGVCLALVPIPALLAAASWGLFWRMWHTVSAASLLAACVLTLSTAALPSARPHLLLTFFLVLVILLRHRDNIARMRRHEEFSFKIEGPDQIGMIQTDEPDQIDLIETEETLQQT